MASAPIRYPERDFVEVLGVEGAFRLFHMCGGATTYFGFQTAHRVTKPSHQQAALLEAVGEEGKKALAQYFGAGNMRIPLANMFLARVLASKGDSASVIAQRLRISDVQARQLLKPDDKLAELREKQEIARVKAFQEASA